MLRRILLTTTWVAVALGGASPAAADPVPPSIPNPFSYPPVNPANYTVNGGRWFAFAGPAGVVCVLDTINGEYGCSGPLPAAPGGANLVSAGPNGMPVFATTETPQYAKAGAVLPLPPNTRLSYRQVACGVDDSGVVACLNTRDQVGFVVGPNGSFAASNRPAPVSPAAAPPA
ncbi:MAG: hypothetical protein WCJ53_08410 [Mycobacteriaceae bacterium]